MPKNFFDFGHFTRFMRERKKDGTELGRYIIDHLMATDISDDEDSSS